MESNHTIHLRTLIEYFDNIVGISGFVLNLFLLYLIIYKTSTRLKEYRPILLQNCLIDTFFNIVNTTTKAQVDQKDGNFYIYMIGPLAHIKHPYNIIFIGFWIFALFYCVTGIPVQFVYRYLMIVKEIKVRFVHYFMLLFIAFILPLIYVLCSIYALWPNEERWENAAALLKADHNYDEGIPNFVVASIDEWPLRSLVIYAYFLVCNAYVTIIFSNLKVWRHLKSMKSKMSIQARDAQRQLTVTFIFQAIIPCVVCLIPIGTSATMAFIHANVPSVGLFMALLYSAIPIANPLLTLIVVKNYRKTTIFIFKNICGKGNRRVETMATGPTIPVAEKEVFSIDLIEQLS